MQKLTKITSTIGPMSAPENVLRQMIENGMNVCRLNFSHDAKEVHAERIATIRKLSAEFGRPIAIMADLQGPKNRIGDFAGTYTDDGETHRTILKIGQTFTFDSNPALGDNTRVYMPESFVLESLSVGDRILLNDGKMEMQVTAKSPGRIDAVVIRGTEIWDRRGFNLPDTEVNTSVLTDKDRENLDFVLKHNPDFVAISFVQKPEDVTEVRNFITARTSAPVKIIVKIERPQGVERFEEIADVADAVMVARGDLAVEMPFWEIPAIQRYLIRACRKKNRPIIVATQMLASMADNEFPLRSEISDVATAAYLRADSVMTSEETTIGHFPVLVVETMSKILANADTDSIENSYDWNRVDNIPENDWSRSVTTVAYLNKATAIVVFDRSGRKSREISCRRPDMPIVSVCNLEIIANQLCLSRGVRPIFSEQMFTAKDVCAALAHVGIVGGKVVVVDGDDITMKDIECDV